MGSPLWTLIVLCESRMGCSCLYSQNQARMRLDHFSANFESLKKPYYIKKNLSY